MKKLAIITTHPIQYYAPVFKLLHQRGIIQIKVFYTLGQQTGSNYDSGFGKHVSWDLPLLDDYIYEWVLNTSVKPSSSYFRGIVNPGIIKQIKACRAF